MTLAFGVRGARRSEHAIRAATTKQTVVKKPKIFWARVMVVCIFVDFLPQDSKSEVWSQSEMQLHGLDSGLKDFESCKCFECDNVEWAG